MSRIAPKPRFLLSYHQIRSAKNLSLESIAGSGVELIIDSGAFSAFTQGVEIPLAEYARFVEANASNPNIVGFFNLDAIGDPAASAENFLAIAHVPKAIPVWQKSTFDPHEIVDWVGCRDFVAIGGLVSTPARKVSRDYRLAATAAFMEAVPRGVRVHTLGCALSDFLLWPESLRPWSCDSFRFLSKSLDRYAKSRSVSRLTVEHYREIVQKMMTDWATNAMAGIRYYSVVQPLHLRSGSASSILDQMSSLNLVDAATKAACNAMFEKGTP